MIPAFAMLISGGGSGGGGPPVFAPSYLDGLSPAPRAAYSLRKKISTATNSIRVRRSSDNAELDIGFMGDALDTASLAAFVGAGSAYVVTAYDQTGNGFNASQTTAANQPRIVNAGVYDGKIVFNGTSHSLKITALTQGAAQLGVFACLKQANSATSKIILEGSSNFNSNTQCYLFFIGSAGWSMNMNNTSGGGSNQRQNTFTPASITSLKTMAALWDRALTGASEEILRVDGVKLTPTAANTVEGTGTFSTYDAYIGARGGTSLYADMDLETLVIYNSDTNKVKTNIEDSVANVDTNWFSRFNAPTAFAKFGSTYFMVDCWHSRVLYADDIETPAGQWKVLDDARSVGPHSIATDGYLYVVDDTQNNKVQTYKSDGAGGFVHVQSLTVATGSKRPHRVQYDAITSAFYVILGGMTGDGVTREMVKLTRSGDTLTIANTSSLSFIGGQYSRGFNIIGGKMYIVAEVGKVYEVSFNSTPIYTLDATYNLPSGFESPNDVYQDSNGDWWVTATANKILKGASLTAIAAGTYTNMYTTLGLGGTPYYLTEFDGAMWIPEIIDRNGLTKLASGVASVVHNYGTETASSLARHNLASF